MNVRTIIFALALLASTAFAHDPGLSSAELTLNGNLLDANIAIAKADAELLGNAQEAAVRILTISTEAGSVSPESATTSVEASDVRFHLTFSISDATSVVVRSGVIAELPLHHRQYLAVKDTNGVIVAEKMLSAETPELRFDVQKQTAHTSSASAFLKLGVMHILTGYDHLLFLFGLLIVSQSLKDTIKTITAFTVAHSLSLALAAFNVVQLSSRIVEPAIAVTITYVGLENIFAANCTRWRSLLTFGLGLVHGLAFAGALRELGIATAGWAVVPPLLSFNLGVEIGQLGVALLVLPLLGLFRRNETFVLRGIPACSMLIAVAGAYWFIERVFA